MMSVGHHTSCFLLVVAWSSPPPALRTRATTVAQFLSSSRQWAFCLVRISSHFAFMSPMCRPSSATHFVGFLPGESSVNFSPPQSPESSMKSEATPLAPFRVDLPPHQLTYHSFDIGFFRNSTES